MDKNMLFAGAEKYFILFSKSGFTKNVMDEYESNNRVHLIRFLEEK